MTGWTLGQARRASDVRGLDGKSMDFPNLPHPKKVSGWSTDDPKATTAWDFFPTARMF